MFAKQYGPWALIAGGSEGVGASFARRLAAEGINLALVARKPEPLNALADAIRATNGIAVRCLAQDLTAPDILDRVRTITDDVEVGLFIYNAGSASGFAEFLDAPAEDARRMVALGVITPTILTHHFAGLMRPRRRGGIMLIGSMAGYAGAPEEIVYSAGKAYSRMLAEGLWHELKPHGVHVLGLILGLTRTPAMERLGLTMDNPSFPPDEPDEVAVEGLRHLSEGPLRHVGGKEEAARFLSGLPREQAIDYMAKGSKALHG